MIRNLRAPPLWALLRTNAKPLVWGPIDKCLNVHMHHQIISRMPFPWPNSIQITVFVSEKPSEKTFRPNDLMPGFCKTICAQDQNLYLPQVGAIPKSSPRISPATWLCGRV